MGWGGVGWGGARWGRVWQGGVGWGGGKVFSTWENNCSADSCDARKHLTVACSLEIGTRPVHNATPSEPESDPGVPQKRRLLELCQFTSATEVWSHAPLSANAGPLSAGPLPLTSGFHIGDVGS